ncbi:uncharacterized protein LOC134679637 [Cydia fagiglandana]|uniref:uncharacterized protein LOC134679637 n=1 Tax=Cydia fagiglandana TaxID=1458189 RepID=UPI002FEE576F
MGILLSRHHSWCCVKGRLHAAATRRRAKKYCQCGKGGRQFRRPKFLMIRRKRPVFQGCTFCSGSYNCCHDTSPGLKPKLPNKSILHASQITSKPNLTECACTKTKNCNGKAIHQAGIQNLCRFTVDAYFT